MLLHGPEPSMCLRDCVVDYIDNTKALNTGMHLSLCVLFVPLCCQIFYQRVSLVCVRELFLLCVYLSGLKDESQLIS